MKILFRTATLYLTAAVMTASVLSPPLATAAPSSNDVGQALEIAPPVISLIANPGQTLRTNIALRDVSTTKLIVQGQVNDFEADGEDGTPKLLLDEGETSPYSMKSWIRPLTTVTLKPKQIENLPVVIDVPKDAAPGGYFSVVRFTATAPDLDSTGVSLSASLGALVFVRVNGKAAEKLTISEFSVETKNGLKKTLFESLPIDFIARIKNEGNVHEQPAGQITINDMFGKNIARLNVNLPPRNILPGSIRRFEVPLDSKVLGKTQLFGRYTADVRMTYGEGNKVITDSITFWVIPYKLIGFGILGLIVAFFVLRKMIRNYNQAIIRRAQGTPKPKKSRRK